MYCRSSADLPAIYGTTAYCLASGLNVSGIGQSDVSASEALVNNLYAVSSGSCVFSLSSSLLNYLLERQRGGFVTRQNIYWHSMGLVAASGNTEKRYNDRKLVFISCLSLVKIQHHNTRKNIIGISDNFFWPIDS